MFTGSIILLQWERARLFHLCDFCSLDILDGVWIANQVSGNVEANTVLLVGSCEGSVCVREHLNRHSRNSWRTLVFFIVYDDTNACNTHWAEPRLDSVFYFSTDYDKEVESLSVDQLLVIALRWERTNTTTGFWYWSWVLQNQYQNCYRYRYWGKVLYSSS